MWTTLYGTLVVIFWGESIRACLSQADNATVLLKVWEEKITKKTLKQSSDIYLLLSNKKKLELQTPKGQLRVDDTQDW